ncbi:hypothetical protein, conserved [Leishmania donovani]|uniref:Uncharacterized protein n=1 Tax=Leishmania donovani TaxID=5661 RepID=A0A3S5H6U7_LEIDO|nr:hypothetical protein, conserved [Leishmania donovani]AYU77478.1 hypothetical protein LdCL_150011600 [Leishmania donovani]TPP47743.1 hypothetical protein CGC21_1625 [Leishmania donovani]CBZ32882.1 hypothetical protein, conserved [Leishmania donovani]
MSQTATAGPAPPPPEEPLTYPITFTKVAKESPQSEPGVAAPAASSGLHQITIFSALHWLLPVYELAGWLPKTTVQHSRKSGDKSSLVSATAGGSKSTSATAADGSFDLDAIPHDDVRAALRLLPVFEKFFVEGSKIIPQHTDLFYFIESFTLPTPKGPKVITRSKVEGDYRAVHQPSHAPASLGAAGAMTETTVTNSTAYFSLLPGHNQFLLYYEDCEKLRRFTYLQLDQLRFAWVAVKELLEESKVFNLSDGSLTGLAKRDLQKNNAASPFCLASSAPAAAATESAAGNGNGSNGGAVIGRGGGNARLRQGTSGNVIIAPSREATEEKKRIQQMRFLREELESECQRRWPYTPVSKSCIFSLEEKIEAELPADALEQLGIVGAHNTKNSKNGNRRGPRYYLATVDLPLLNKKGGAARFKSPRWWNNRRDAESAAAEATLLALRSMKS